MLDKLPLGVHVSEFGRPVPCLHWTVAVAPPKVGSEDRWIESATEKGKPVGHFDGAGWESCAGRGSHSTEVFLQLFSCLMRTSERFPQTAVAWVTVRPGEGAAEAVPRITLLGFEL